MNSIYIHIPFCVSKCQYCDFPSYSGMEDFYSYYVDSLVDEIKNSEMLKEQKIDTVFIGGGTPSIMPAKYIYKILNTLYNCYSISDNPEITIEANPGTIDLNKLKLYKSIDINRISMGVQAWQNKLLKILGRIHDKDTFIKSYCYARDAGFNNINVDLMFAVPNQNMADWKETLANIIELKPEHISAYSLIIEEGTPFFDKFNSGELNIISDEDDRNMYHYAVDYLEDNGYHQYEISNFSKVGFESRHNMAYWKRTDYKGFGLGAHSFVNGVRFSNTYDINEYLKGNFLNHSEAVSLKDAVSEFIFLGLRMTKGISISDFYKEFNVNLYDIYENQIDKLLKLDLIDIKNDKLFLTKKGIDLSNIVFLEFI